MTGHDNYIVMMSAYIDGELSEAETGELFAHIDTCPSCRSLFDVMRTASDEAKTDLVDPPEALLQGVMQAINEGTAAASAKPGRSRILYRYLPIAACIAIIVFAAAKLPGLVSTQKSADSVIAEVINDEVSDTKYAQRSFSMYNKSAGPADDSMPYESYTESADNGTSIDMEMPTVASDSAYYDGESESAITDDSEYDAIPNSVDNADYIAEDIKNCIYRSVITIRGAVPDGLLDLEWFFGSESIYIVIPADNEGSVTAEIESYPECELVSLELVNENSDVSVVVVLN